MQVADQALRANNLRCDLVTNWWRTSQELGHTAMQGIFPLILTMKVVLLRCARPTVVVSEAPWAFVGFQPCFAQSLSRLELLASLTTHRFL